jgi:hypothetical protein
MTVFGCASTVILVDLRLLCDSTAADRRCLNAAGRSRIRQVTKYSSWRHGSHVWQARLGAGVWRTASHSFSMHTAGAEDS